MNLEARIDEVRAEYLRRMTQGDSALLRQVEDYTTSRNGKLLRPRMLLTAAATLGEAHFLSRHTLLLAVCVEMIHNTSLLHDDVIDRADSRREQPSVNARWNNAVAVLVGDYLLTQIMELLDEVNEPELTRKVNQTVRNMVEAELLQQEVCLHDIKTSSHQDSEASPSLQDYLRIIDGKTANLFALAAEMGNPAYRDFGLHYGRLFQLHDDVADGEAGPYTPDLIIQEKNAINNLANVLNI